MFYPPRESDQKRQRQRTEDRTQEETDLRDRIRESWPGDIVYDDGMDAEEVSGKTLRRILQEHDRPHRDVRNESWHVNGTLGRQRRFAFTATFSLTAVNSSVNPPDESSDLNNLSDVQWTITDNSGSQSKYYRFSCLDHRAPALLSALLAKGELGTVEEHLMQATVEQLNRDVLVCPDQCMTRPATARFSELDLRFGDSFLRRVQPAKRTEGVDVLSVTKYHMHLEGSTNDNTTEDPALEAKATLDIIFSPRVVPMLDGDHGIIGHGDWKDDMYYHCFPHMKVEQCSLRVTRASDDLEYARELEIHDGAIWMDHRFGGVVPRSPAEAEYLKTQRNDAKKPREDVLVDRCMLRLFNKEQDCIAVTRIAPVVFPSDAKSDPYDDKAAQHLYASVQSGKTRSGYGYWSTPADRKKDPVVPLHDICFNADASKQFRSEETGVRYPLEFHIRTPLHKDAVAELTVRIPFPHQELPSSLLQPSDWIGTVTVDGTITRPAPAGVTADGKDTITSRVVGEGFLQMHGHGMLRNTVALLDALRAGSVPTLQSPDVATQGQGKEGWKKLADGPALHALSGVCMAMASRGMPLTDDQKVVVSSMLATYAYIYHHPTDADSVEAALVWCQGKWITYFGRHPIDSRTLLVRAFMLRELGDVMRRKCPRMVPSGAAALDIAVMALQAATASVDAEEAMEGKRIPAAPVVEAVPTALELSQLKALLDGKWVYKDATGSISAVLVEQHVPVLWRNLMGKVQPTCEYDVDREAQKVSYTMTTILEEADRVIHVNGQLWSWRCPARGQLTSRACVLENGRQLYVESYVRGGVERIWYTFGAKGTTMQETTCYYRTRTDTEPAAWCIRHFVPGGNADTQK